MGGIPFDFQGVTTPAEQAVARLRLLPEVGAEPNAPK
jgi:hypothetical protein